MNGRESGAGASRSSAMFVISVAAQLAGMHPQTLRQYDRLGLVSPRRTAGRGRRYSSGDIDLLRRIQQMRAEGINLAGIAQILSLEERLARSEAELAADRERLRLVEGELAQLRARDNRVFTASASGEIRTAERGVRGRRAAQVGPSSSAGNAQTALVLWRPGFTVR
ncbi:heat shock protein transcriptional repressor HspR [Buchananella hordeovulneris]|uniref:HTH merR-type domain-containing protein n=1 Tax=Buchananella hordeovulneris TaxID=52770 RepID=A0A1Q5PVC5_9ACTO|nr:helix-turn-helix transcriptional regulator [Buchananella hordeovulneris]MDO5080234.1 helix-turn-helix transcriptional regulator [Buchananella hordeovulneris]OKL51385.1 hypothetical protein BSZ40_07405 [Buchananella hordeovulneris]RRD44354.1 MerR family transcriptional regulator [Buchananella hordeovulneris]